MSDASKVILDARVTRCSGTLRWRKAFILALSILCCAHALPSQHATAAVYYRLVQQMASSSMQEVLQRPASRKCGFATCVPPHMSEEFIQVHRGWLRRLMRSDADEIYYEFTSVRNLEPSILRQLESYSALVRVFTGEHLLSRTGRSLVKFEGYYCKMLALTLSELDDIIWLDFDVFLLKDPRPLRETKEYVHTGTLFFREYSVLQGSHGEPEETPEKRWHAIQRAADILRGTQAVKLLGTKETFHHLARDSPIVGMTSFVAAETSLMLFNRDVAQNAINLLLPLVDAVLQLSPRSGGREYLDFMHGDCEFFWTAMALIGKPFSFSPWSCSYAWIGSNPMCFQAQIDPMDPFTLLYVNQVKDVDVFRAAEHAFCEGSLVYGREQNFSQEVKIGTERCVMQSSRRAQEKSLCHF